MRKYNSKNAPALSHWNSGYFVQCPHRLKGRGKYVMRYLHPEAVFRYTPNSALHWEVKWGLVPSKKTEHAGRVAYLLRVARFNNTRKGTPPQVPSWLN